MNRFICHLFFLIGWINSSAQPVDYYTTIEPVLQLHCMPCHAKTSIGAMPLTTYQEVKAYGKMVQYVTENKVMPPWQADAGFSALKNHNSLNENETAAIKAWVKNGMPQGKTDSAKKNSTEEINSGIAKPDLVLAMEKPFTVADDYTERSQVFVIPSRLKQDKTIEAIEFVPGNRKIIKSCTLSVDTGQTGTRYDSNDISYGYNGVAGLGFIPYQYNWYQWTADEDVVFYVPPTAKKLLAGSKLLFHIVYVASTAIQKDSSYLKLRFVKNEEKKKLISSEVLLDTSNITNGTFTINPGDKRKFYAVREIKKAIEIYSVMPMGQSALSSWEIYAVDSLSGQRINLLKIPHWDAHWKKKYLLQTPVHLSAGSKIFGIAYYNNSDDNRNLLILPPKKIKYGQGQRDELFVVQFDLTYDASDSAQ